MTHCLICGKSDAEQMVAQLTTRGGLTLRLCEACSERWRGYGLVVTAPQAEAGQSGLILADPASASAAAAARAEAKQESA